MQDEQQQAVLVAEIAGFLGAWQQLLRGAAAPDAQQASKQRSQAELLRARAAALGLGGLAQQLARCSEALGKLPLDVPGLRESLRAISEITWQLREELKASLPVPAPRVVESLPPSARQLEPPPRITAERASAGPSSPATPQLASRLPSRATGVLAQSLMAPPLLSSSIASSAPVPANGTLAAPLPAAAAASQREAEPEPAVPSLPSVAARAAPSNGKHQPGSPGLLATLFGLRAFGASPARLGPNPARQGHRPASSLARGSSLFGFGTGIRPAAPLAAPPLVTRRGALPPLAGALPQPVGDVAVNADLEDRLRQIRPGPRRRHSNSSADGAATDARQGAYRFAIARWSVLAWTSVFVLMVLGGVFLGKAFLALDRHFQAPAHAPEAATLALEPAHDAAGSNPAAVPAAATREFQELVVQVHGLGGEESPELAALLNAEANATFQALSQHCAADSSACAGQREARDLLTPKAAPRRAPQPSGGPPPRWLAGLKIPTIGAHNDPEVQRWVEYYTGHSVGRELFQTMLFRCGAQQDLIDKTLVHYGLPLDLLAVVLTESACVPNAESAVGARGLWQFMAPTARAYHLYVQEGVVDERLSPVKSTEAAVKYLADLYRKLGSWEMALASYNAGSGPFRMLARLRQAGAAATFWDLVAAQLIPEETAEYVPRIQAYAVILANLRHFDFSTAQLRTAEETSDLEVPARARLGQVARAAGTSVAYLRALNPDLVGTLIPSLPDQRFVLQVPKAAAQRARETLAPFLLEQLDLCVPSAFDWGRERFTAEMQTRCAARRGR